MNLKTIVVSHYHWLSGGVRTAVEKSLMALNETDTLKGVTVHLVVGDMHKSKRGGGRGDGKNLHIDTFRNKFSGHKFNLKITEDARLNYTYDPWPDEMRFRSEASDLAEFFFSLAEKETVFWLHNVNLCKNPLVTEAWLTAARLSENRGRPHYYLFHIHDFAECGRIENIVRTRYCWGTGGISDIYPSTANTGFAVLSATDKEKLVASGVHRERVFHIPNVISKRLKKKRHFKPKQTVWRLISDYAKQNDYQFYEDPNTKCWLLPIRLIRRKNVLESIVLSAVSMESVQLLLTLNANSPAEMYYADKVSEVAKRNKVPMVIAFGNSLIDEKKKLTFDEVMECADAVISTSLMEGFGYAFTDPVMNNKQLIARNLHNATVDLSASGFPASELYNEFKVPVSEISVKKDVERLMKSGRNFAEKYKRLLKISHRSFERFVHTLEGLYHSDIVDFGMLNLEVQLKIVNQLHDNTFLNDISSLNSALPHAIDFDKTLADHLTHQFGQQKNATSIIDAFNTLPELSQVPVSNDNISQNLLDSYFTPHDQRPLYSDW